MQITIEIIPAYLMRYDTWDDWQVDKEGNITFQIADAGNDLHNKMTLVHALIEQLLTEAKGVSEETITKFDLEYAGDDEPGEEPSAPYRDEHLIATAVEMLICSHLGLPWKEYNTLPGGDLCDG
jgi:hypothetical protein